MFDAPGRYIFVKPWFKMFNFFLVALSIAIIYMCGPYFQKLEPVEYSAPLPIQFEGPMAVNNKLDNVEKLFENEIYWPESMAVQNGEIYSGLGDGRIVRFTDSGVKEVSRIGKECEGQHEENICGRPLGMRFDSKGKLYLVDAYYGLYTVDVETGKKNQLVSSSMYVDGKPLTFLNCLAIDEKEQIIYMSQSTSKWNISMVVINILEHETSGRLLKYDLKKNIISVIAKDLSFPNGVELSHDGNSILVAEGNKHRILRYHIRGAKKDQLEPLPLVLPGEPDNISRSPRGHYWVGLSSARTASSPNLYDRMSRYPLLRKSFLIAYHMFSFPVSFILRMVPSKQAKEIAFEIVSLRILADVVSAHGLIVEFDEKGNVVQSLHGPSGKTAHISEILEKDGHLYLGSWRNRYLGKVKL